MNIMSFLSPIQRLPNELLSEIFVHCLPDQQKMGATRGSFRSKEAPLLLGSVCSHWRAVSLSTQELWSFVWINFSIPTINSDTANANIWLERAKKRPLSLALCQSPSALSHTQRIDILVHSVLSISHQCHHIMLDVQEYILEALSPMKGRLPLLQSQSQSPRTPKWSAGASTCDTFEIAPNLRKVHLAANPLTFVLRNWSPLIWLKLPWTQLTEFVSDSWMSPQDCFQVLRNCPILRSCTFERVYDSPPPPFPPLRHSQLRNLNITTDPIIGHFFNCLVLPTLRAVHLYHPTSTTRGWSEVTVH